MKPRSLLCAAALLALAFSSTAIPSRADDTAGKATSLGKAPDWTLTDLNGKSLSYADLKGKVVVVDFWATWCGPCVSEIPGYVELQKKYADQGLVIVGLSIDQAGPKVVEKFVKDHHMSYRVAMADDAVQSAFGGFDVIPTTFVINRQGEIAYKKTGAMAESAFEDVIKPLLK